MCRASPRASPSVLRLVHQFGGNLVDRLDLSLELESMIRDLSPQHERRALRVRIEHQFGLALRGVAPDERHRNVRAFDRCAWHAHLVHEVSQLARDRAPASGDARLGDAYVLAARRFLVDHERERQELREQFLELREHTFAGVGHAVG
jgi:hypothetical protein